MSNNPSIAAQASVKCGSCECVNSQDAKFCESCGHSLYEPCGQCSAPVLLKQRFCGGCGADLVATIEKRQAKYTQHLQDAVTAAKESRFDDSLHLLSRVAEVKDFRFAEQAAAAAKALDQVSQLKQTTEARVAENVQAATIAEEEGRYEDLVNHLTQIPKSMMDKTTEGLLRKAENFLSQVRELSGLLVSACSEKDWPAAGHAIGQLTEMLPDNPQYAEREKQISEKLRAQAERAAKQHDFAEARNLIDAIPTKRLSDDIQELSALIDRVQWMMETLQKEPIITPAHQYLADKLVELIPNDPAAAEIQAEIQSTIEATQKNRPAGSRCDFSVREQLASTWMGGQAAYLTHPKSIDSDGRSVYQRQQPGRYGVAIGLALQGLGDARIKQDFSTAKKKIFGRRKKTVGCWGIDIGSRGLKAVRLEKAGDAVLATDFFYHAIDRPAELTSSQAETVARVKEAVDALKENHELDNDAVWSNLPSKDVTFRFVRLPPVKDKQLDNLVESELTDRVPIDFEDLVVVRDIAPLVPDTVHGRAASFVVVRRQAAQKRESILAAAGIEIDGLQADSVALTNFVHREFKDLLVSDLEEDESNHEDDPDRKLPSVAILDAGASTTTITYVSRESFWSWPIDTGGDDIDRVIARAAKVTHSEAEQLKKAPHKIEDPESVMSQVSVKMQETKSRLQRIASDANSQNGRFDVKEVWIVGGGGLPLGYARHVICGND